MAQRQKITRRLWVLAGATLGLWLTAAARADRVVMHDGTVREGIVLSHDEQSLLLQMGNGGLRVTVSIPLSAVAEIHITPKPQPIPPATSTRPASTLPAGPANGSTTQNTPAPSHATPTPAAATAPATMAQPTRSTRHFLHEWLLEGLGLAATPFDKEHLPPDQAQLWDKSFQDEANKDTTAELADLTALATAPGVDDRLLNKLSYRYRHVLFGAWLAKVRWAIMQTKGGPFDLTHVTPIEIPALMGYMRAATPAALEPLKNYYPLPPSAYEVRKSARPHDPLSDIQVSSAIALKDKASYALALLTTQLKLEPDMSSKSQLYLRQTISKVQAVFGKCLELEPQARAAAEKDERERKNREQKLKLETEQQKSLAPPAQTPQ